MADGTIQRQALSHTLERQRYPFITRHILVGFPVSLWCPDMKSLVMFPDWLDWWWRHMALIRRLFNLSAVTMPRVRRLIEFADGLSWHKMFRTESCNFLFFCLLPAVADVCVCVCVCMCGLFITAPTQSSIALWVTVSPHL